MYALSNRRNQALPKPTDPVGITMSPEEFCDRFLPLRYPGEKLDARSGRRLRCLRFLAAVLSQFTGELILESRVAKWGPGLTFSKIPCPFTALLALLAQFHAKEIKKIGKRF
jgi:hypothetical protein